MGRLIGLDLAAIVEAVRPQLEDIAEDIARTPAPATSSTSSRLRTRRG